MTRPGELVNFMIADGQTVVACTDHGDPSGSWAVSEAFREYNGKHGTDLRLAPGIEAYVAIGNRFERGSLLVPRELDSDGDGDDEKGGGFKKKTYQHLTIHAYNASGYSNLMRMHRESMNSFYKHPLIDFDLLAKYAEGLNIGSGCMGGVVAEYLKIGDEETAVRNLERLYEIFGREHLFVEIMTHGITVEDTKITPKLVELAKRFSLPLVATNDSHFARADQRRAHQVMLAVGSHGVVDDPKTFAFTGEGYHLRTEAEMRALINADWWQQAVTNTQFFADQVEPDIVRTQIGYDMKLPTYSWSKDGADVNTEFSRRVKAGAVERYAPGQTYADLPQEVKDRLREEVSVFRDFHGQELMSYMLIEADACDAIRADGTAIGSARGSSAGSLVAFCLKITNVEPLKPGLLFSRFLNLARKGLPDVDTDLQSSRQVRSMKLIAQLFGEDKVARVGRRTMKQGRSALKAVGTAMGAQWLGEKLAAAVPAHIPEVMEIRLSRLLDAPRAPETYKTPEAYREDCVVYEAGADLRKLEAEDEQNAEVIKFARSIEGCPMSWATHTGGLVVADRPLHESYPIFLDRNGEDFPVLQMDYREAEASGLVKYDFLPIKDLDRVARAAELVELGTGEHIDISDLHPDANDERAQKAKAMLAQGRTAAVFQLSSSGMTELVTESQPDCLSDLTALVALYRPGPMAAGMHKEFAARRRGFAPVDYQKLYFCTPQEAEVFATVIGGTYGLICMQEDMMTLSRVVAGFDDVNAGKLQKAISKKQRDVMAELKKYWMEGGQSGAGLSGVKFSERCLEATWTVFEGAGSYAFNKSHAAAYAYQAWLTAWFKANFPVEFCASNLEFTTESDKRAQLVRELSAEGVVILPPDVNRSSVATAPDGDAVLWGLSEIKRVGKAAQDIVTERAANGPYLSLSDFKVRTGASVGVLRALADAGALDLFGPRLGVTMSLQVCGNPDLKVPDCEYGVLERSARQVDALGILLDEHPLRVLGSQVRALHHRAIAAHAVPAQDKSLVQVVGLVESAEERKIRSGRMLTLTISSSRGRTEVTMWPDRWEQLGYSADHLVGKIVAIEGRTRVWTPPARDDEDNNDDTTPAVRISVQANGLSVVDVIDEGVPLWKTAA